MHITVRKGLDIPVEGKPLHLHLPPLPHPSTIALHVEDFSDIRFTILAKPGASVKIGDPLLENKQCPGQFFVSPAGGRVSSIQRGLKRRVTAVVIEVDVEEQYTSHAPLSTGASREEILRFFMRTGLFPHIRLRPFHLVPQPKHIPRDIFITAYETRPFTPSFRRQLVGYEEYFTYGVGILTQLTPGCVHVVQHQSEGELIEKEIKGVELHTVSGPHPAGSSSVHIHHIAPIQHPEDYVWTLSALDVAVIGKMAREGRYLIDREIAIAGNGVKEEKRGFVRGRVGYPIEALAAERIALSSPCFLSGDPLTGFRLQKTDYLRFADTCFTILPENTQRESFHFLRLGGHKYSATRAYLPAKGETTQKGSPFTTNQHGEHRPFIDGDVYDKVMPMRIPTMQLIKAILVEDYELAEQLGLLEVIPEDFVLPTFICPSKTEMVDIVQHGLRRYAKEMGY